MSGERRYNEKEIKAIFKQAAAEQEIAKQQLATEGGLTLEEIEAIGKEAGITPEFIARAAATVEHAAYSPPPSKSLGRPISVAKVIDLPGDFTDEDWDQLVGDLHDTYQIPGETWEEGSVRHWKHGRLHVLVEPHRSGHRLRMFHQDDLSATGLGVGLIFFLMGLFFTAMLIAKGGLMDDLDALIFVSGFTLTGLGGFLFSFLRLPRWRQSQEEMMAYVAQRAISRSKKPAIDQLPEPDLAGRIELEEEQEMPDMEPVAAKRRTRS